MTLECNRCGSEENVKNFQHFDPVEDEMLCWECRRPIIFARLESTPTSEPPAEDEPSETNDPLAW